MFLSSLLALGAVAAPLPGPLPLEVTKLAEGVYAVIRPALPSRFADANNLIIVNDSDVVVVDANLMSSSTLLVLKEIRKLTSKPVRYVINTHWHDDHFGGNHVYQDSFPAVEIIAHANTLADMITDLPSRGTNLVEYPKQAARFDSIIASGKRADGTPLPDASKESLRVQAMDLRDFAENLRIGRVAMPGLTFERELTLHRGSREISIRFLGNGNTRGDAIIYLPKEKIVATGDLMVHPIPFAFGSYMHEWPATLKALHDLDADILLPGHGPIMRDKKYLETITGMIASLDEQVRAAKAKGMNLEDTRKAVNLDRFKAELTGGDERKLRSFDYLFFQPGTEAAWNAKP